MASNINKCFDVVKTIACENNIKNPENMNMINLAYIGDIIYDFYISDNVMQKYNGIKKINDINKIVKEYLCAKGQARFVEKLVDENILSEEEIEIYKHARNAKSNTKSKNSSIIDYRKATGFEALLGYLYYKNNLDRLSKILSYVDFI